MSNTAMHETTKPGSAIELKGSGFTLSVLQILSNDMDQVRQDLLQKINQAPQFFYMAPVVLNIEGLKEKTCFATLKQVISDLNLVPVGVSGGNDSVKKAAHQAGLAAMIAARPPSLSKTMQSQATETVTVEKTVTVTQSVPTKVIQQNLRSGQQIYAKDTDIVVIGSVSNGAEIIADGNIHIYGTLRGRAIAGASGDDNSRIFCHKMVAELVSINGHYWTSEQLQEHWQKPVCISLASEQLKASPLDL